MSARSFPRRLALDLAIIAGIGLVAGLIGPFGTFAAPLGWRIGYWMLFALAGFALFRPMAPLADGLAGRTRLPRLALVPLVLLLPSIPMTGLVLLLIEGYHVGDALAAPRLLQLFAQVWLLGTLVFGLFMLIHRDPRAAPAGPTDMPADAPATTGPALADRLAPGFGPILALRAEDHYVRVIGETGSALLLMRLADAIGEMGAVEGSRVHRSWWVARAAVLRLEPSGRRAVLHLANGETAPVSRDNLAAVRAALPRAG